MDVPRKNSVKRRAGTRNQRARERRANPTVNAIAAANIFSEQGQFDRKDRARKDDRQEVDRFRHSRTQARSDDLTQERLGTLLLRITEYCLRRSLFDNASTV